MNESKLYLDPDIMQKAADISFEAKNIGVKIDKEPTSEMFSHKLLQNINRLANSIEIHQAEVILELFDFIEKLDLKVDISEAQNTYYNRIFHHVGDYIDNMKDLNEEKDKYFIEVLLNIGKKLNINTDFYRNKLDKVLLSGM